MERVVNGKLCELRAWETHCDTTNAALGRLLRALLAVRGHFTSAQILEMDQARWGRGVTVFLVVLIPEGYEEQFEREAKVKLKRIPRLSVNR